MTTVVSVAQGGTGSNSAALARTALGVPPSAAYDQANTARDQANTARTQANTAYDQANTARTQANTAYGQANAAYGAANTRLSASGGTLSGDLIITGNLTVSGNSTTLNTEILTVEDADIVLLSNVASTPALNAGIIVNRGTSTNTFLRWNEAIDEWGWSDSGTTTYYFDDLRAGLATTNTTFGTINTSLGTINTSYQAAYAQANTARDQANTARTQANTAYDQANTARTQANTAYGQANSARDQANTAYGQANAAYGQANVAYGQANTARNTANSAYGQANTATTNAGNAYDTANNAYTASSRLRADDLRTIAPNSHTAGRLTFGFTSYTNNGNASSYADYLHFRSYTDSSGGSDNLVMFHKSGIGMRIWQQTWNSSTAYSNYVDVLHSSNYSSYAVPLSGGTMTGQLNISSGGLLVTGNVGIGTSSPVERLQVSNGGLKVTGASTVASGSGAGLYLNYVSGSNYGEVLALDQGVAWKTLRLNSADIHFYIAGGERMRLTAGGTLVLNGTAARAGNEFLTVYQTAGTTVGYFGTTAQGLYISNDSTTPRLVRLSSSGDFGGGFIFTNGNTDVGTFTLSNEFIVGGTTDQGAYNLQCNGTGVWGAGAYVNGSDARLKDNIQPLDSGLDVVNAMHPVTFQYKQNYSKDQSVQPGFIAQELQEAMAGKAYLDGVVQEGTNHLNVAYQNIIPILVKAIQEQQVMINELMAKVTALESK
jgi:hypothetical protein